ncbi:MAG: hypothetical protein GY849_18365 [Deltaproteobacteria bacterium]|nr:hypothetical protein [Deltaproteobacteria bacterium]
MKGRAARKKDPKMVPITFENIASIPSTVKRVVTDPVGFFNDMPTRGGFVDPLIFMVSMGVVLGVIQAILSLSGLGRGGSFLAALFSVVLSPVLFTIIGFVIIFILYCIWNVMGSRESFGTAFRCGAYCTAIAPAVTLMGLIPYVGSVLGLAWTMYLLIVATTEVHHIEAKIAWIVFGAIWAVFAFAIIRLW